MEDMNNQLMWIGKLLRALTYTDIKLKDFSNREIGNLGSNLVIMFKEPITNDYYLPIKILIKGFATENECTLKNLEITDEQINLTVFFKNKNGLPSEQDPIIKQIAEYRKMKGALYANGR